MALEVIIKGNAAVSKEVCYAAQCQKALEKTAAKLEADVTRGRLKHRWEHLVNKKARSPAMSTFSTSNEEAKMDIQETGPVIYLESRRLSARIARSISTKAAVTKSPFKAG